ncbi:putative RNA-directed DNA polymerase [Rosa chinensis]|uniref:Putative RNA-directed DNA polymerase n=1 Tax=Rosa chinensis TaxID=74649 RepID=A0A2P6PLI7_ROSCH|nr:putative RNA-directed DNA polymerase [Rosa chinensis]
MLVFYRIFIFLLYEISASVQVSEGSEIVAVVFKFPNREGIPRVYVIIVIAQHGCWTLLKGGIVANFTSPVDIVFEFMQAPTEAHYAAVKRILRYLIRTTNLGLTYRSASLELRAFSDADWAGDPNDRRSTTGFVIYFGNCPISWCSKKQHSVSRSSTEAEYRAMADTASEIFWLRHLLQDIDIQLPNVPILHCDNVSALALASNPVHKSKCKHVEVDVHFTREKVLQGDLTLQFVPSLDQFADIFTKGLSTAQFSYLCCNLVLGPPSTSLRGDVETIIQNQADQVVQVIEGQRSSQTCESHNIIWEDPNMQPLWLKSLSSEDIGTAEERRINSVIPRYKGQLIAWYAVNENLHFRFFKINLAKMLLHHSFPLLDSLTLTLLC